MSTKSTVIRGAVITSLASALIACGGSSSSSSSDDASVDQAYAGPGSKWDVTLNDDDSFNITRRDTVNSPITLTVEGTYDRLASGFVMLTVGSSEGEDGPSNGDQAWALEVPGYAFFLNPIQDDSSQMIAMVDSGNCPSSDFDANWVMVKKSDDANADDASRDFFGTFSYDASTGEANLPVKRSLEDPGTNIVDGGEIGSGTCDEGIMTVGEGNDVAAMYLTSNGGAIIQTDINDEDNSSFVFGLAQKAIAGNANLDGEYAGLLFDSNQTSGEEISPVSFSCSSGTCTGNLVTNIQTGETSADSVTVTFDDNGDDIANGLITATITSDGTGTLGCLADTNALDSGKKLISCVGQSPGDNSKMFNIILVTKQ